MLTDYYDGLVFESTRKGQYQVDYFTNELLAWLTKNVDFYDMQLLNKNGLVVLRNQLMIYASLIDQKVNSYQMIVEDSKKLKRHMELILESE